MPLKASRYDLFRLCLGAQKLQRREERKVTRPDAFPRFDKGKMQKRYFKKKNGGSHAFVFIFFLLYLLS